LLSSIEAQTSRQDTVETVKRRARIDLCSLLLIVAGLGVLVQLVGVEELSPGSPARSDALLVAPLVLAALAALIGSLRHVGNERPARVVISAGILLWVAGESLRVVATAHGEANLEPTAAVWLNLAMYPCVYVGLVMLLKARSLGLRRSVWADGLLLTLGVAAVYVRVFASRISRVIGPTSSERWWSRLVHSHLAYPIGDLMLVGIVIGVMAMLDWHPDALLVAFLAGCLLFGVSGNELFLHPLSGTYGNGSLYELGWPAALFLWAVALNQRQSSRRALRRPALSSTLFAPVAVAMAMVAVIESVFADAHDVPLTNVIGALATGALVTVLVRLLLSFAEVEQASKARRQALTDELTGLRNRRALSEHIRATLSTRGANDHALLLMGLTAFSDVTDAFGHLAGDALLVDVANRIAAQADEPALPFRFGDSEFAVWLPVSPDGLDAIQLADRLLAAVAKPFAVDSLRITVRASVGIALYPGHARHEIDLLRLAQMALLEARESAIGQQGWRLAGSDSARSRIVRSEELRHATRTEQLVCHYQPKIDLQRQRLVGVEALVRWNHPDGRLLGPGEFLPNASEAALLGDLSRRVLEVAIAQSALWASRDLHIKISVNLSPTDLLDPDIVAFIDDLLHRHGVQPGALMLEVTEETFMLDAAAVRQALNSLRDLGTSLSIDDYGTGYSSLSYLRRIPAQELKLDAVFVNGISSSAVDRSIVKATVALAHSLGMQIVAEGVENEGDLAELMELGCDLAQGYYFSRPLAAEEFERWLVASNPARFFGRVTEPAADPIPIDDRRVLRRLAH